MEGNNAPVIRFNGFNAAWEQRKLGELFVESDERSSTEEILSVSVANGIYPASESERDTNPGASIANYKIVRVGDIVYNSMRMWQGAVGSSRYNGIVSPAYVVAKPVVELDSTCFGYLLKRPELLYKYLCNSQGNSKDTQTLRYERFAEITADVPSTIEEQRAISNCLEGLDNLITLHQRKCDKLVKLKPAMLNRMFPKPGDSEPEIRFAGFKEPWERYKLGDVAAIARGERFTASDYVESGGIPCIHYGEIYTSYGTIATKTFSQVSSSLKDSLRYAKHGDVIVAATSENVEDVCKAVVWTGNSPVAYHDDSFALTFSGDPIFLVSFFETSEFFAQKSSAAHGVKVMRVSSDSLADVDLPLPSAAEQRLIGGYFAKLDNLITLHRRKIKGLKKIKSAMLDKMFV